MPILGFRAHMTAVWEELIFGSYCRKNASLDNVIGTEAGHKFSIQMSKSQQLGAHPTS